MANKTAKVVELEVVEAPVNIEGMTKNQAFNALFKAGIGSEDHQAYWKEYGSKVRGGIFQLTLDYLAKSDRTQSDLAQFILDKGTRNEARWFSSRDAIRRLSIAARGTKGFKEVSLTESQKAALKAIVG